MIKRLKLSLALIILLGACKHFEPQALDDSQQLAVEEGPQKGLPALSFNNGMLDDFGGDISPWWGGTDLSVVKFGDTLRVIAKGIGSKYTPFGRQFPALDMSEAPVLRLKLRYEGLTAPDLRIDLKDIYGMVANSNSPKFRVRKGGYRDYYFNFEGKFKQAWPDTKPVDASAISEMMFFINPGTADWTGSLFIDEVQIIKVSDIPAKKTAVNKDSITTTSDAITPNPINNANINAVNSAESVLIDDFNNTSNWASSKGDKIKIAVESGMLKVDLVDAGPAFENFSKGFKAIDFTKTPVVKIRAKVQNDQFINLRLDIKDVAGFSTNAKPIAIKLESGTDFVDYYFDFTDKYEQTYPNVQKVNPESIVGVVLYVNPGGKAFTGKLYIDEIKAISLQDFNNKK